MIPRPAIIQWGKQIPWKNNEQLEQDMVISRALIEIFSDEYLSESLAFRGGSALYKLYFKPPARYSEDIDFIQMKPEPIGKTIDLLRSRLSFLGEPARKQKERNTILIYSFNSETPPVVPMRLKIEINCREHFTVFGLKEYDYNMKSDWFRGSCQIKTFIIEELLGSKLRALYQRKKGRDLFDIWYTLTTIQVNTNEVISAFKKFMKKSNSPLTAIQFIKNMEEKLNDSFFTGDTATILNPEIVYNPEIAWELVRKKLIEKI